MSGKSCKNNLYFILKRDLCFRNHSEKYPFSSFISDIFSFPIHESLKCGKCDESLQKIIHQSYEMSINLSEMKEEFLNSMNETEKKNQKVFYLNDVLTYFFYQNKTIPTPNSFKHKCPKCGKIPESLNRSIEMKGYPNVLCIHLNRFAEKRKETMKVEFPTDELSLNDFFNVLSIK